MLRLIDSTVNILDHERGVQLMTPRKPKSGWTRLNRDRVAALEAQGRMIVTAGEPSTRANRITKIVTEAEQGRRAAG